MNTITHEPVCKVAVCTNMQAQAEDRSKYEPRSSAVQAGSVDVEVHCGDVV